MLKLKNIVKTYGTLDLEVQALNGVSLYFRRSEFVSILGPSGCGKTTLLNIIGGLDRYTSGDLVIKGTSTTSYKDREWDTYRNNTIGFVFQSYNLIPHLSVLGNVELALAISGYSRSKRKEMAIAALEMVGLKEQINKKPNQMSGGQMQRVAIARALVNNPRILLADEPTGALDSETSVQIMELLKEIAKDRLVIMVTHNPDLAKQYSTRIIQLLDGKVVGDDNPYSEEEEKAESEAILEEEKQEEAEMLELAGAKSSKEIRKAIRVRHKQSSMTIRTAVSLSSKNLIMKKGRTIMIALAGSIGIIGIALILAVSNGLSMFINDIQREGMSEYPITISPLAVDMESFLMGDDSDDSERVEVTNERFPDDPVVFPYNPDDFSYGGELLAENDLDFVEKYLGVNIDPSWVSTISYSRQLDFNMLKATQAGYQKIDTAVADWQEYLTNAEYGAQQYDPLLGSLPSKANEIALFVSTQNTISVKVLNELGIECEKEDDVNYRSIPFEEIVGKSIYLIYNDAWYQPNSTGTVFTARTDYDEIMAEFGTDNSKVLELKVVGVVRPKEGGSTSLVGSGIVYTNALTEEVYNNCKTSAIVLQQEKTPSIDVKTGKKFEVRDLSSAISLFFSKEYVEMFQKMMTFMNISYDAESMYRSQLCTIGGLRTATQIYICPTSFENKEKILAVIDKHNATAEDGEKINYVDTAGMFLGMVDTLIDVISKVLIAFCSISLIVSSLMIGIITYVSVVERTKEIGVLRSLGARKKDISRVFNAETFIIGASAGIIAIVITYIVSSVASAILKSVTGVANLAVLDPLAALVLVLISITLTLVAGLIPARLAAAKDPVVALRTE